MGTLKSRQGAAKVAMPLMLLSFVLIGGFMYWLNQAAAERQVAIAEEPDDAVLSSGAPVIRFGEFAANPSSYLGREIQLAGVTVVSKLGNHAFWTNLSENAPYLVRMTPDLVANGLTVVNQETVDMVGQVYSMSDSVLDAWTAAGTLTDDVQRIEAEFATEYFEARLVSVRPSAGADAGGSN